MLFETKYKDGLGRIGKMNIHDKGSKSVTTPIFLPVVNPNKMTISTKELKDAFKAQGLITNAYILKNSRFKSEAEKVGIHKFLSWDGLISMDSGAFQFYSQHVDNIKANEIVKFQKKVKSDFITPLDVFVVPEDNKKIAKDKLIITENRINEAQRLVKSNLVYPIQGGIHLDIRKMACLNANKSKSSIFAIGGLVPLMENYDYKTLVDVIMTCRQNLRWDRPIHAFGCGNVISLAFLTLMGCDIFDSAYYALAAKRGGYITFDRVLNINSMKELPCSCPICTKYKPEDLQYEKYLAMHNLYVIMAEMRNIREAINENRLWELVAVRARSHEKLYEAYVYLLKKYHKFFEEHEPITKRKVLQYTGEECKYRPELTRVSKKYRKVPSALKETYPFNALIPEEAKIFKFDSKKYDDQKKIEIIADFQFGKGVGKKLFKNVKVIRSPRTRRIRKILKNGRHYAALRPKDGLLILDISAIRDLKKLRKGKKIVASNVAVPFVRKGKTLFCPHVKKCDKVLPNEQVIIVDSKDNVIATGDAIINCKEMMDSEHGIAVEIRQGIE